MHEFKNVLHLPQFFLRGKDLVILVQYLYNIRGTSWTDKCPNSTFNWDLCVYFYTSFHRSCCLIFSPKKTFEYDKSFLFSTWQKYGLVQIKSS